VRRSDNFARWLLSFAGEIAPVAPDTLVQEYQQIVHATYALYATADGATAGEATADDATSTDAASSDTLSPGAAHG